MAEVGKSSPVYLEASSLSSDSSQILYSLRVRSQGVGCEAYMTWRDVSGFEPIKVFQILTYI